MHLKDLPSSSHVPPFLHGLGRHLLLTVKISVEVNDQSESGSKMTPSVARCAWKVRLIDFEFQLTRPIKMF